MSFKGFKLQVPSLSRNIPQPMPDPTWAARMEAYEVTRSERAPLPFLEPLAKPNTTDFSITFCERSRRV